MSSLKWRPEEVKELFPIFSKMPYGKPLVYLDSAATTQKPRQVLEKLNEYYKSRCGNVHRGTHFLSEKATELYEQSRRKVQHFIGALQPQEVIFTKGTTESINLVAASYGQHFLKKGDEILLTHLEHHSNIVPWQLLAERSGCVIRVAPVNGKGELVLEDVLPLITPRVKLVALTHVSNAIGTIAPVQEIISAAHEQGAVVLLDGAQAIGRLPVDVVKLDCDFYAFSGHKMYGPTGIGVLYGKNPWLNAMPPYQGGGDMIASVTFEKTSYADLPYKFEAGTPPIGEAIALGAAIDFMQGLGMEQVANLEEDLLVYGQKALEQVPGVRLVGEAKRRTGILSFVMDSIHPHDISTILDRQGVAIRAGHLCAQPLMRRFRVPALARASFGIYNTHEDVDALVKALYRAREVFDVR